jgi:trypsin-like peptidase
MRAATTAPRPKRVSFADLVAKVRSGVMRVEVETCAGTQTGTGFLLRPRLIATVEHVVEGATAIELKRNGRSLGTAEVIGSDPTRDLALLRSNLPIPGHRFTLAQRRPRLGEGVAALGFPLGLPLTLTRGSVSGSDRTVWIAGVKRRKLIQTDAALNPGNSGGPLLSAQTGDVIGLVDLKETDASGIGFAVSAEVAEPFFDAWRLAPQPISGDGCGEGPVEPSAAPPPPSEPPPATAGMTPYDGSYFRILYPSSWIVRAAESPKGSYLDTTIASSDDDTVLVRVDVTPSPTTDLLTSARQVEEALARQRGYRELAFDRTSFMGYDAIRWEFLVDESGVSLHKTDTFFETGSGAQFAILTQAPTRDYASWIDLLEPIRSSLVAYD